jgi:acyl carrier protein phosphodiesterase
MNFLAHIYLSGDNDLIKIGNFMADGIRGKQFEKFPEEVQKGILLHRNIDTFTDAHPIFRTSTKRLHEKYHHYAGVIVDVFYDHFLARNWDHYSDEKLSGFVTRFYTSLEENKSILTEKTIGMMPYIIRYNWLESYQTTAGIKTCLSQMDKRIQNDPGMRFSLNELHLYYKEVEEEFTTFFKELRAFSQQLLTTL